MASEFNVVIHPKKSRGKPTVQLINPHMANENVVIHPKVKKEKEERESCSICTNYYTTMIRKKVVCKYCTRHTCSKCVEQYLLSRHDDAHCMHCRVNYSDAVLREICTKTYLQQSFFLHRQEVLMNRSRAQLPALQDEALRERRRRDRYVVRNELAAEYKLIFEERQQLRHEYRQLTANWSNLRINEAPTPEEKEHVRARKSEIRQEMEECETKQKVKTDLMREIKRNIHQLHDWHYRAPEDGAANAGAVAEDDDKKEEEKKRFIRRCIREDCKGFLSQAWKCGMCEWYSCNKCFDVKGPAHDSPHECTADALETAALIRKNCKPCPKCGEQIEHGGGCSQMWCISCQTPWDWNTGKIVTSGPIHNPLYYEWQRRTGGAAPRNPGDIPCGGYPEHWELIRFPRGMKPFIVDKYYEFFRICQELRGIARNQYRTHIDEANNNHVHVRFLLKDYNEKIWGWQLACIEKKKKRDAEIQEVFAAFHMVAIELVNRIHQYRTGRIIFTDLIARDAEQMIETLDIEIQELIQMINHALQTISISYSHNVPYIHVNDISNTIGLTRRIITIKYKNFSHDVKKRRVKKGVIQSEVTDGVTNVADGVTDVADVTDEVTDGVTDVADEVTDVTDEVAEVADEDPRHPLYDSDSDQSVTSDIQAAIADSLQSAYLHHS